MCERNSKYYSVLLFDQSLRHKRMIAPPPKKKKKKKNLERGKFKKQVYQNTETKITDTLQYC